LGRFKASVHERRSAFLAGGCGLGLERAPGPFATSRRGCDAAHRNHRSGRRRLRLPFLTADVDLVLLDAALASEEIARVVSAARAAARPPFTVLLAEGAGARPFPTDGLAAKPSHLEEAKHLMESVPRVRLPSRVLIVDDSATMRAIVRKILAATRFPLEIIEAAQGIEAIELARQVEFNVVFLDYNMLGFSGLETMAEFRREKRRPTFVLMTSAADDVVAGRARTQGAAFLKKPFFPADIEAVLCGFYGLRALNPERA
jgi:CheY-like chemotaxis protein